MWDDDGYSSWCFRGMKDSNLWHISSVSCPMMFLHNLAEPNWVSVHCNQKLLTQLVCVKDEIGENNTFNKNSKFVQNKHFCTSNAILVNEICYEFHWVSNVDSPYVYNKIY